jgi:copper homeostasis protein (lipoprotein)
MNNSLALFLLSLVIFSCSPGKSGIRHDKEHGKTGSEKNQNASDWIGHYAGILPCADCEGIQTEIRLNKDLTCELATRYLGKNDQVYRSSGTLTWNDSGNIITIKDNKEQPGQNRFLFEANRLIKLDAAGNRIEGELSEMYILSKVAGNQEITGRFWKLMEVDGKKIAGNDAGNREAHFILLPGKNRVTGHGGCNSFSGTCVLPGENKIRFSKLLSTRMACANLDIENAYFKALESAEYYSLEGDTLSLKKPGMPPLARCAAVYLE